MATIPFIPDLPRPPRPAAWRRIAPWVALALVFAVGAGLGLVQQAQQGYRELVSSAVIARWAESGAGPLGQAMLLLGLWMLLRIARKVVLFGAFFAVERGLSGPPVDKRATRFALVIQLALALLYATGATGLLFLGSLLPAPSPLLNLSQAGVESLLGPLASPAIALAALVAYDFMGYWAHRAQHRFAVLWRFHAVHHSIEEMDSLNSYAHPADLASIYPAIAVVSLTIGFTFETMLWLVAFQAIHDRLLHTRAPINFGRLGALLVDNRTHYLHHARAPARSGRNFASTFTLFDRLFGTYERPAAGPLPETGLEDRRPPAALKAFFLARLGSRKPFEQSGETGLSGLPGAGGCRPSA